LLNATSVFFNRRVAWGENRIKGAGHKVKGSAKEAAGKVTGDKKTQALGAAEKLGGKIQNAAWKSQRRCERPLAHGRLAI
jgi:uncharacterized protein YjbJ (UPF0337 family)